MRVNISYIIAERERRERERLEREREDTRRLPLEIPVYEREERE